ncbi:hypothetical protein DZF79_05785 [Vibrio parahaemolyticus]|nr:hypothetical protein [Vibrio parahaemolyticus]
MIELAPKYKLTPSSIAFSLKDHLKKNGIQVKQSKAEAYLAKSLGYGCFNDWVSESPKVVISSQTFRSLAFSLKRHHNFILDKQVFGDWAYELEELWLLAASRTDPKQKHRVSEVCLPKGEGFNRLKDYEFECGGLIFTSGSNGFEDSIKEERLKDIHQGICLFDEKSKTFDFFASHELDDEGKPLHRGSPKYFVELGTVQENFSGTLNHIMDKDDRFFTRNMIKHFVDEYHNLSH